MGCAKSKFIYISIPYGIYDKNTKVYIRRETLFYELLKIFKSAKFCHYLFGFRVKFISMQLGCERVHLVYDHTNCDQLNRYKWRIIRQIVKQGIINWFNDPYEPIKYKLFDIRLRSNKVYVKNRRNSSS